MRVAPQWATTLKRRFAATGLKHSSSGRVERRLLCFLLLYATCHIALMVVVVKCVQSFTDVNTPPLPLLL